MNQVTQQAAASAEEGAQGLTIVARDAHKDNGDANDLVPLRKPVQRSRLVKFPEPAAASTAGSASLR